MRIGLISTTEPLINGGSRFIVDWLHAKLVERGYQVETILIPTTGEPDKQLQQMLSFHLMKLDDYFDRVITFRPPAHMVRHPNKVVWFIHHQRAFYDLWDTEYRGFPDLAPWRAMRQAIMQADTIALKGARAIFSNSQIVRDRLREFNGVEAEVLYPPVLRPELFRSEEYGGEIVCICRMEHHKRQHLALQAMELVRTPVRLRLSGLSANPEYAQSLQAAASDSNGNVVMEDRWITEDEKADRLAKALAVAYIPFEEDSYGYPTIEGAHARRATVTLSDSGGVLEFVTNNETGLVVPPDPVAIAGSFDQLYRDRHLARRLGDGAAARLSELRIDWDSVIARLMI